MMESEFCESSVLKLRLESKNIIDAGNEHCKAQRSKRERNIELRHLP